MSAKQDNISMNFDQFKVFSKVLQSRSPAVVGIEAGFFVIITFATLFGNILLCAVLFKNFRRTSITSILILSLSLADILMGVLCMPLSCAVLIHGRWLYGDLACELQCFSIYFLAFASLQTIVLTSLNRFFRVVKPAKYKRIFTLRKTATMLVAVWSGTALILAMPWLFGKTRAVFNPAKAACVMFHSGKRKYYPAILRGFLLVIFAVIPTCVTLICYFKIFRAVGMHFTRVEPNLTRNSSRNCRVNSCEMRITVTLFAVVVMFVLSWLPVFLIEIVQAFIVDWWKIPRQVQLLWTFFGSLSSAANPLVYGFANSSYRREYRRLLTFKWKGNGQDASSFNSNEGSAHVSTFAMATLNTRP